MLQRLILGGIKMIYRHFVVMMAGLREQWAPKDLEVTYLRIKETACLSVGFATILIDGEIELRYQYFKELREWVRL